LAASERRGSLLHRRAKGPRKVAKPTAPPRHHFTASGKLIETATTSPAKISRLDTDIGAIAQGKYTDFVVINVTIDPTVQRPLDPIVKAPPADVTLVVVGRQAVYQLARVDFLVLVEVGYQLR
jgi:cytosine/adenosine deaminase-related metal-dependent hydrolase